MWRASHLWFNFDVGIPMSFEEWFGRRISEVQSKSLIWDSIFMLWVIWCARNEALFQRHVCNVDNALTHFLGIRSLCRLQRKEGIVTDSDYGGACGLVKGREALKYVWRREGHALYGCHFFLQIELGLLFQDVVQLLGCVWVIMG
ncbi:hypothetical protein RHGRI_020774 [Rhododendron griersonianum]|uniref:Uncharacterized protein n=1 Tax=Rhododendron griersonianum TaxID=479676 RepID=A0AAV6JLX4_9ERIC|nr:hypothetical protein RHGRI_020774 [Rhododendron griersonianum]